MAVVLYQRAEPRQKEWFPLLSQQIRLRNVKQISLVNPSPSLEETGYAYFTLHMALMSAPFYTSPKIKVGSNGSGSGSGDVSLTWPEIQVTLCSIRLSVGSCIIKVWTGGGGGSGNSGSSSSPSLLVSWAVNFKGLHHLGMRSLLEENFVDNTIVFSTPFGNFTSLESLRQPSVQPQRYLQLRSNNGNNGGIVWRSGCALQKLKVLHSLQRSVLEEHAEADRLRTEMGLHGYLVSSSSDNRQQPSLMSERLIQRARLSRQKLRLKEEMELVAIKVRYLIEERGRAEGRLRRLKKEATNYEEMSTDLVARMHNFNTEKINLREIKCGLISNSQLLAKFRASVFLRKKQLISELLQIYPLDLIEGSKRFSINGVQLPNAEDYGSETGAQISVALGYTAHFTAMLAFFLDVPLRYPIRHFGSRSRIIDHITVQIPDKEREFPLYFKGKRDVYCAYAIYLLNKNIAQLRWFCGLATPDLRATLPNIVELLRSRLIIPGWPPNLGETLEVAQEITEDIDTHFLMENEFTLSLDEGLDKLKAQDGTGEPILPEDPYSSENPGNNSTALGEIKHGRGQDRFLSGWRKKTYDTDDFQPKLLMDTLNLDFDRGRRLSLSNSSPPSKPILIITDDESSPGQRRRKTGLVEPPASSLQNVEEGKLLVGETLVDGTGGMKRNYTPSREMARLESDIKEWERKKSRGAATSMGIPSSTERYTPTPTPTPPTSEPSEGPKHEANHLSFHDIVSDSSKLGGQMENNEKPSDTVHVEHSEVCNPIYHIPPPVTSNESEGESNNPNPEKEEKVNVEAATLPTGTVNQEPQELTSTSSPPSEEGSNKISNSVCDTSKDDKEKDITEDSLLWMRTEALMMGSQQSFNLVRQKMPSESSSS